VKLVNLPAIVAADPPMICNWYLLPLVLSFSISPTPTHTHSHLRYMEQAVTMQGADFMLYNDEIPSFTMTSAWGSEEKWELNTTEHSKCSEVAVRSQDVWMCNYFEVTVPQSNESNTIWNTMLHAWNPKPENPHASVVLGEVFSHSCLFFLISIFCLALLVLIFTLSSLFSPPGRVRSLQQSRAGGCATTQHNGRVTPGHLPGHHARAHAHGRSFHSNDPRCTRTHTHRRANVHGYVCAHAHTHTHTRAWMAFDVFKQRTQTACCSSRVWTTTGARPRLGRRC
jgi:hypothetical protein